MKNKFKKVLVELRPSKITLKGVGVFAITNIKKGTKIFEGVHIEDFEHLVSWSTFNKLSEASRLKVLAFCVGTSKGFIPPDDFDFNNLSIEWYLNHSCEGNVGFNSKGDFIALKNIKPNEELSYDYGLVESNPKFKMPCACGSAYCRKIITGEDWKKLKNNPLKFESMHPYLKYKT